MLLVDNAAQPMQAAPVAALKGIAVSGNASKLPETEQRNLLQVLESPRAVLARHPGL